MYPQEILWKKDMFHIKNHCGVIYDFKKKWARNVQKYKNKENYGTPNLIDYYKNSRNDHYEAVTAETSIWYNKIKIKEQDNSGYIHSTEY